MTPLNITQIQTFTPDQFITYAHKMTAVPALIMFFILSFFVLAMTALGFGYAGKKFWQVYLVAFFASLIILLVLLLLPVTFTQTIMNWISWSN